MSKHILFIPFSENEDNFSLYMRALNWRLALKERQKLDKVPGLAIYQPANAPIPQDFEPAEFVFNDDNLTPGTTLYVLADGMGDAEFVGNTNDGNSPEKYFLSMDIIAQRAREMGLTPALAKNIQKLKLFVCDTDHSNELLAVNLAHALGEDYKQLKIAFYETPVSGPNARKPYKEAGRFAMKDNQLCFFL